MIIQPVTTTSEQGQESIAKILNRFESPDTSCQDSVKEILDRVRKEGDDVLVEYGRKFDSPELSIETLQVSTQEMKEAYEKVDDAFMESLTKAIERVQSFHEREMEDSWMQTREDGTIVGRLVRPVDTAGLYVPGGQGGSHRLSVRF